MGWRIENYPSQLFITNSAGNSKFYLKATLSCYASSGQIIIEDSITGVILAENPADIDYPITNSVNAIVKEINTFITTEGTIPSERVSSLNSTTALLAAGATFTGDWEDVSTYPSSIVAVKTDQNGTFSIQYSPDGVNLDSTLTRYYRTNQIEAPHRFTNTRKYSRTVFTNTSSSAQTYLRLQTLRGSQLELNAPIDSVLSQDFDAVVTRPTDYHTEVALGRRQGATMWNKFGYNQDVDMGTEVIASWGGAFTPLTTATTLTIVSTNSADDNGNTGCESIVVYGIDKNRDEVIEVIEMNGTTNVVTSSEWLGINRVVMFLCGSGQINAGTINITATTGGSQMAQIPAGSGVTQQCIFHVPRNYQFISKRPQINVLNRSKNAELTIKMWVYSAVSNGKQEIYREDIYTATTNDIPADVGALFPITEKTVIWLECTTDTNDISVNARFSGELIRDVDA